MSTDGIATYQWHRNIAKNFNRLSIVHERYRQTDRRQTDDRRRRTTYSEREHYSVTAHCEFRPTSLDGGSGNVE